MAVACKGQVMMIKPVVLVAVVLFLVGCMSVAPSSPPPARPPVDAPQEPGAPAQGEAPPSRDPSESGGVEGPTEIPSMPASVVVQRGVASWYGRPFHGRRTASGEVYNMYALTAAHRTLPLPSYAKVRNPKNGLEVVVRVNDRGPFHGKRIIDLSYAAAMKLGITNGLALVEVVRLTPPPMHVAPRRK
jgi:rare lipoprotein A